MGDHDIEILTQGPHYEAMAMLSFVGACLLSFALEYALLRLLRSRLPFRRLMLCTLVANLASYLVIIAVVGVHLHFILVVNSST